jgi:hypothetical protein
MTQLELRERSANSITQKTEHKFMLHDDVKGFFLKACTLKAFNEALQEINVWFGESKSFRVVPNVFPSNFQLGEEGKRGKEGGKDGGRYGGEGGEGKKERKRKRRGYGREGEEGRNRREKKTRKIDRATLSL